MAISETITSSLQSAITIVHVQREKDGIARFRQPWSSDLPSARKIVWSFSLCLGSCG